MQLLPSEKLQYSDKHNDNVVASSSISFASLLAASSDTEKCVKLYVHAMLMYLIVSFEK